MFLVPEIGIAKLAKKNEELCGDAIEISRSEDSTVVVLSDGLGSGVKANILATLTTKIAAKMIQQNVPINEVVETIVNTLPICRVRDLAYSTFTIIKINSQGQVDLVEYDGPPVLKVMEKGIASPIATIPKDIAGRIIREAKFSLKEDELLVIVSDGVTQAGLGGILPLGWGIEGLASALEKKIKLNGSTQEIANGIIEMCEAFYVQEPGDDTTVIIIRLRKPLEATVLTGPPKHKDWDREVVERLMEQGNVKIVCGGTTANIVSRELNRPLNVNFCYIDPEIPPIAHIEGIDLVTEGILTLTKGLEIIEKNGSQLNSLDGSSLLVKKLLSCDKINFLVGTQINPAHQNPELPIRLGLRKSIVEKWKNKLEEYGKIVNIQWY